MNNEDFALILEVFDAAQEYEDQEAMDELYPRLCSGTNGQLSRMGMELARSRYANSAALFRSGRYADPILSDGTPSAPVLELGQGRYRLNPQCFAQGDRLILTLSGQDAVACENCRITPDGVDYAAPSFGELGSHRQGRVLALPAPSPEEEAVPDYACITLPDAVTAEFLLQRQGTLTLLHRRNAAGEQNIEKVEPIPLVRIQDGTTAYLLQGDVLVGCLWQENGTSLRIPEGVRIIRSDALEGLRGRGVERITLPDTLTCICAGAFAHFAALEEVQLPHSVTHLEQEAFAHCTALKRAVMGKGLVRIARFAFGNCTSLQEVVLQEGLAAMENRAFYGCSSLCGIRLPDSLVEIGLALDPEDGVFAHCDSLKEARFPRHLLHCRENNLWLTPLYEGGR